MSDEGAGFFKGMFMVSIGWAGLVVIFSTGPNGCLERSHRYLGSQGAPCFANHTCRENLVCLWGEGASPGICAKDARVGR